MQPTEAGRYIARPVEWTVKESNNHLPQFVCKFDLLHKETAEGWADVSQDQMSIFGYFNLVYLRDGQQVLNEISVKSLVDAFGWDGSSLADLANNNWSRQEVQVVLEWDNYGGKDSLKLKYLNQRDYEGGMKKAAPEEVQSIESKYGSLLRATAKKNGALSSSNGYPPRTTPAASRSTTPPPGNTKAGCWAAFKMKVMAFNTEEPAHAYTPEKMVETFKALLGNVYGVEKDLNTLTPGEWQKATTDISKDFSPATGDLLQF